MDNRKRLLVFHRNGLFRDCLVNVFTNDRRYHAQSVDHLEREGIDELLCHPADVVLLDLNLPENRAIEIARAIKDRQSETKVLVLVPDDHERLVECIAAGAHGCVLERSSLEDLDTAITKVWRGETFCCPDIVATMFAELSQLHEKPIWQLPDVPKERRLTAREQEVLCLIDRRMSNKEIASQLCISLFTVKNHVHKILDKLDAANRQEAAEKARLQKELGPVSYRVGDQSREISNM